MNEVRHRKRSSSTGDIVAESVLESGEDEGQSSDNEAWVNHVETVYSLETSNNRDEDKPQSTRRGKNASKKKIQLINQALLCDPVDVEALKEQAVSTGGLLNDHVRRKVWPKLLQLDPYEISPKPTQKEIEQYREYTQVVLDVNRTLKRFPPGIPELRRLALQDQLTNLIVRVLMKHPELHYYQGYHDICITFLLVAGEELGFALVEKISLTHLAEFLRPTMQSTAFLLYYVYAIVGNKNPKLRDYMEQAELGTIFCLSWVITWFGHVLGDITNIVRLCDFFIASPPIMPVYLTAAIVLHKREELLSSPCEMVALHTVLTDFSTDLPFEELIKVATSLYSLHRPDSLLEEVELLANPRPVTRTGRSIISAQIYRVLSIAGAIVFPRTPWWRILALISVPTAVGLYLFFTRPQLFGQTLQDL